MPISMHTACHFGEPSMEIALREEMCDGFVLTGGASKIQREAHQCQAFNKSFFLQIVGTRIAAACCCKHHPICAVTSFKL